MPRTRKGDVGGKPSSVALPKRTRFQRNAFPRFLELPVEVRRLVLNKILCSTKPIEVLWPLKDNGDDIRPRERLYGLTPAVLLSCKSMHSEGRPLLYSNTIACICETLKEPDENATRFSRGAAFGTVWNPAIELPPTVLREIRKMELRVHFDYFDDQAPANVQMQIREVARIMRNASWKIVSVKVSRNEENYTSSYQLDRHWQELISTVINPLQYIRNLDEVTVTGLILPNSARELSKLMMSKEPLVDLETMYEELHRYVAQCSIGRVLPINIPPTPEQVVRRNEVDDFESLVYPLVQDLLYRKLTSSRDHDNVSEFFTNRARLIRLMSTVILRRQNQVLGIPPESHRQNSFMLGPVTLGNGAGEVGPPLATDTSPLAAFERECYYGEGDARDASAEEA